MYADPVFSQYGHYIFSHSSMKAIEVYSIDKNNERSISHKSYDLTVKAIQQACSNIVHHTRLGFSKRFSQFQEHIV